MFLFAPKWKGKVNPMESSNQFLGTERIGKLMRKYAIPCVISLLVGALYNIVDQIFIANASYLGSYGNAANTVVFPLTVVALAIAVMIGDGCCAFVSISLGQNEVPKARRSVGNAVVMCLVSSIVLAALYLFFADAILAMFGGTVNAETYHHSQEYFFYITLGVPFYMFGQAMNPIIRADGNPRFAMISTLAGAVLNIILDPIFIFGFRWGMMGAAVATVIGQLVTAALAVWYLLHMKIIRPEKGDYRLKGSICGRTLTLGMTSFLSQISLVAAMAAINNMIRKYGALDAVFGQEQYAQIPMAVVGIVMKFFQIVISIVVGMAAGCIPVVGFNMGAKKPARVKELFTKLLLAEAAVGVVALVLVEGFPRQLIALFGAANESVYYTDFAVKSFRIYLCMIILACVNKACFIFLQAMGKAVESTALSMVREVVFGVGFALLLPRFFGLDGVLYSMPIHYFMGGIQVDERHRTSMRNLYAAGECCAQYHGANRLGGNSLLGAIYGGQIAAETACRETVSSPNMPCAEESLLPELSPDAQMQMNRILLNALGVVRDAQTLEAGIQEIRKLSGTLPLLGCAMLESALARKESRGAHWRADYPQHNDAVYCKTTVAHWNGQHIAISFESIPERRHDL